MPHPLAKLPPNSAGQNNETMPYEWEIDLEDVMDHDGIQVSNPDQIMSSSVLLPQTISTDRDHISLVTTLELDPLSPTVPLPTVLSETDANMSSSMESLPLAAINLAPLDHTPSKAPTYKLTPVPLTIPLPKESNGAAASGQNSEGWMDGTEDGTAVSAEPGRMHTLIYSGLPIPLSSWPFTGTLLDQNSWVLWLPHYTWLCKYIPANHPMDTGLKSFWRYWEPCPEKPWRSSLPLLGGTSTFPNGLSQLPYTRVKPHYPLCLAVTWQQISTDCAACWCWHQIRTSSTSSSQRIQAMMWTGSSCCVTLPTVLQCFRQKKATLIQDIVLFLLRHGTPFNTCVKWSQVSLLPLPSMPLMVLGWQPVKHKPTLSEYNFYKKLCSSFFDHPRSGAAQLKGGITLCLALEGGGEQLDSHVLEGPSDEVLMLVLGTCISGLHNTPKSLWDDDLSEADMNLLCGIYKVYTGKSGQIIIPCHPHQPS